MTARTGPRAWHLILLVVVAAGGGLMVSLIRLATVHGVPFVPFAFWNTALSAALLLVVALARGVPPRLAADHLRTYASLGVLAVAFPLTVFAFVAPKLPASIVAITSTLIPILTYALALIVALEQFRWLSLGGIVLGLAGVLLLIVPEASLPEPGMAGWVLVVLLTSLSLALAFIAAARYRPPQSASVTMAAGTLVAGALLLLPVMAIEGSWWFLTTGLDTGALALLGQCVLYAVLWFTLLRDRPSRRSGVLLGQQLSGAACRRRLGNGHLRRSPERLGVGRARFDDRGGPVVDRARRPARGETSGLAARERRTRAHDSNSRKSTPGRLSVSMIPSSSTMR